MVGRRGARRGRAPTASSAEDGALRLSTPEDVREDFEPEASVVSLAIITKAMRHTVLMMRGYYSLGRVPEYPDASCRAFTWQKVLCPSWASTPSMSSCFGCTVQRDPSDYIKIMAKRFQIHRLILYFYVHPGYAVREGQCEINLPSLARGIATCLRLPSP